MTPLWGNVTPPFSVFDLIHLLPTRYQYLGFALAQQHIPNRRRPTASPESLGSRSKAEAPGPEKQRDGPKPKREIPRHFSRSSRPCLGEYLIHKP
ncbi:hypothetical protein ACSS6W_006465 [Trichoderma asperelloides]